MKRETGQRPSSECIAAKDQRLAARVQRERDSLAIGEPGNGNPEQKAKIGPRPTVFEPSASNPTH
ncbi:hypothetical protein ACVWZA_000636 [Sphingomonas sp. UYAg733]